MLVSRKRYAEKHGNVGFSFSSVWLLQISWHLRLSLGSNVDRRTL
jgi:hypothetical protein